MGAETREADQGQESVNPGDQALKKKTMLDSQTQS